MRRNSLVVSFIFGIVVLLVSCAKEGPSGPTGPAGPLMTGNISGHVVIIDKYGSLVGYGYNDVAIFLNGSSTIVHPDSATGAYNYAGLTSGVYNIASYGTDYDYTERDNLQLVSGTLNVDIKLSATPDSFLNSFAAYAGTAADSLAITCAPDTRPRSFIVFLNKNDTVSNNPNHYQLSYIATIPANASSVSLQVPRQDLLNLGLASGATVYYAAYSYVVNDASFYEDQQTGRNVYLAVNHNPLLATTTVP